jgi:hypothetical protein
MRKPMEIAKRLMLLFRRERRRRRGRERGR